jgi:hypothetical protein
MNSKLKVVSLVSLMLLGNHAAMADDDDRVAKPMGDKSKTYLFKVTDEKYLKECGACHFAYQPGLLPAASWEKIMGNLSSHFGENAELPQKDVIAIRNYLLDNAAGRIDARLSNSIMKSTDSKQPPVRITELTSFKRHHHELNDKMVKNNPDVKSLSRCDACHTRASEASFRENEIKVPGFGRWED